MSIVNFIKGLFVSEKKEKVEEKDSDLLSINGNTYLPAKLRKKQNEFKEQYLKIKSEDNLNVDFFKTNVISLIIQSLRQTEYAVHKEFILEIKYFLHYLFLVIEDDFNYGDNILRDKITQLDNYIFSHYRKKEKLSKNIQKFSVLATTSRFVESPKENILSYFVFLEENGTEIIDILEDFFALLNGESIKPIISEEDGKVIEKKKPKIKKNFGEVNQTFQTLNTMHSQKTNPQNVKIKIKEEDLI